MTAKAKPKSVEVATFGAGCFWCVEAMFQNLKGVVSVESGYAGGAVANPSYEAVCGGDTGHAEACQVRFDPTLVTYENLLEVFWKTHDPTTLNRQGADAGPQYRSVVFYHDARQKAAAEAIKRELEAAKIWDRPVVTEIAPFTNFYRAEAHHQDYYRRNSDAPYCQAVIRPKIEKLHKLFKDRLTPGAR